jgi:hypothetical protein
MVQVKKKEELDEKKGKIESVENINRYKAVNTSHPGSKLYDPQQGGQ